MGLGSPAAELPGCGTTSPDAAVDWADIGGRSVTLGLDAMMDSVLATLASVRTLTGLGSPYCFRNNYPISGGGMTESSNPGCLVPITSMGLAATRW